MNLTKWIGGTIMDSGILRARARANLQGSWGLSIGVAAVAVLLGGLIEGASFLPKVDTQITIPVIQEFSAWLNRGLKVGNITFTFRNGIFGFAAFILGGVLQLGYARFLLKQQDGRDTEFSDLFSQFDNFGTGFAQFFLRNLYVALWSILLVIPGIVKSYSYAMTPFILAEHPELTASRAIGLSMQMMEGHKMDLFLLDLSFLGWAILAALTANLGYLALNPYTNAARAAFYRQLQAENKYTSYE